MCISPFLLLEILIGLGWTPGSGQPASAQEKGNHDNWAPEKQGQGGRGCVACVALLRLLLKLLSVLVEA